MSDPLIRLLAELPSAEPDPARSERTRSRCRARLARYAPAAPVSRVSTTQVWRSLVALLGVAYLTEVIGLVLRLSAK
jgi:hypothetical protein